MVGDQPAFIYDARRMQERCKKMARRRSKAHRLFSQDTGLLFLPMDIGRNNVHVSCPSATFTKPNEIGLLSEVCIYLHRGASCLNKAHESEGTQTANVHDGPKSYHSNHTDLVVDSPSHARSRCSSPYFGTPTQTKCTQYISQRSAKNTCL